MNEIVILDEDIDQLVAEYNKRQESSQSHWRFDASRRHVIKTWADTQACPGSGKTTLVAAKLLLLAQKWKEKHKGICVITHTNVARDEIITKLPKHPSAFKLASYPHFVGTIQEFINKFLSLPYIRSQYEFKRLVDGEGKLEIRRVQPENYTIQQICGNLYHTCGQADYEEIKDYLGSLHFLNSDGDLRFFKQNDSPEIIRASSNSDRRKMLSSLKVALCNTGIFQYRDMYAFASKLLKENQEVISSLRRRFPVVIVDEMQDTQKYQDDILIQIFDVEGVCMQRLGDPDQAIFDGIGGEEPNETYNQNEHLYEINTTHRFGNDISEKIIGLSYNRLDNIESDRVPNRGECRHTVLLYDDNSLSKVLNTFGEIVAQDSPAEGWKTIKAVGGVDGSGGFISQYWPGFDKNQSIRSPRPTKLVHAINLCISKKAGHLSTDYDLLIKSVIDLLRKADVKTINKEGKHVYFTRQSLLKTLKDNERYQDLRKLITEWLLGNELNRNNWDAQVDSLKEILGLNEINEEAAKFLEFSEGVEDEEADNEKSNNIYKCENGQEVEVGTIHSVKGETHDATLILETKFNQFDLQQILPFIIDKNLAKPIGVRKIKFLRKLYVAASRPRHLLCLALHIDHTTPDQIATLDGLGWAIKNIADAGNA